MPNPKLLITLYITLVAALATAQTLPINANIQPYGAPPYSPKAPGTTFNLYEWVVINGTVTFNADFYGNVAVTVLDKVTNQVVAECKKPNQGQLQGTYSLYDILNNFDCRLQVSDSYNSLVKIRESDKLALNFTDVKVKGRDRFIINVTFVSGDRSASFSKSFSVDDSIKMTVKAFGEKPITDGATYYHNRGYNFRLVVNVTHPDERPYYNTSITMYFDNTRKIARYWANNTGSDSNEQYGLQITNSSWVLIISSSDLNAPGNHKIMVNVSNVRVSIDSQKHRVGYNVTDKNKARLNFTLSVTEKLKIEIINVTAVWPNYTSTPQPLRNKPTGVNYTNANFNGSRWTLGDAFLLYVKVMWANGTTVPPSSIDNKEFRDYNHPLITGVSNYTTFRNDIKRGDLLVVAVNATLTKSEWQVFYRKVNSGVVVNASLKVSDIESNAGELNLNFTVTNTTMPFTPRIFYNASKAEIINNSLVNLGDVMALRLSVVTWGGRTLNFTNGFEVTVYNVTSSGLKNYNSLFDIRRKNDTIYLVVKPSKGAWGITKDNWRSFMNSTYLAVNVTEYGMPGRMNLTLWWPDNPSEGRYKSHIINVTARLPSKKIALSVNSTIVENCGQRVKLEITFQTYGGNKTVANSLTLYVYKVDTQTRPLGWSDLTQLIISNSKGSPYQSKGNYTFVFNVDGKYFWIPGKWVVNATVGDIFGNAGDWNGTQTTFEIQPPKIVYSLPNSLRVMPGKMASISSPLKWCNGSLVGSDADLTITIVYPLSDGKSNTTQTLGVVASSFTASIPAPNMLGTYPVVVNFTYTLFGKTMYNISVIRLEVYMSVNATIKDMKSDPKRVAVAVGRSVPRGPVKGTLVEDNLAAAALATVIGTTNVFFDDELLDPNTLAYSTAAGSYRYFIAVGGPLVNLFSYKYNETLSSIVQTYKKVVAGEVVEVGFEIRVPSNITYVYLNLTDNKYRIVYANGTVKVVGDYGKTDFAFVATLYDNTVGKYIFISFGLDWRGTVAAGRWLAANINNLDNLAGGQLVLLQWTDVNSDGNIQPNEVQPILGV